MAVRTRIILHRNDNGVSEFFRSFTVDLGAFEAFLIAEKAFAGHMVSGKTQSKTAAISGKKSVRSKSRGKVPI